MNEMKHQKGFVPLIVIIPLILAAALGGWVGFQLGDGTFFSLGVGIGLVLVVFILVYPQLEKIMVSRKLKKEQ